MENEKKILKDDVNDFQIFKFRKYPNFIGFFNFEESE